MATIKTLDVVFLIFLFAVIFRLFFALQSENFSDSNAYYNARQIEYVAENGRHMTYDELSYGGRDILGVQVFFYAMGLFYSLLGAYALKIMPALLISMTVFGVYIIAKRITDSQIASYFAALCSAFIPVLVLKTLNNISIYSIVLPIFVLLIYSFYRIEEKKYLFLFVLLSFLFPLVHPISFLLAISMVVYLILTYIENVDIAIVRNEAILLFVIVTFLVNFVVYKKAFIELGPGVIWQNIPEGVLSNFFKDINILDIFVNVGFVPLLFGVFGIYFAIRSKHKDLFLLASAGITSIALIALKLLDFSVGLIFLGLILSMMSAVGFDRFIKYIKLTKLSAHLGAIEASLVILIVLTMIVPSVAGAMDIADNALKQGEAEPFLWMKENTALSATVLADIEEGNLVTGIARRKSVFDSNFLFVRNADRVYQEATSLFLLESEVKASELIEKYDIDYIYLSADSKEKHGIDRVKYSVNENCFEKVFENEYGDIIKVLC